MSHGDPYYGNAVEVEHVWVRPPSPDCDACGCCTAPLCANRGRAWSAVLGAGVRRAGGDGRQRVPVRPGGRPGQGVTRDQGAARGGPVREPGWCGCGHLEPLHTLRAGRRGGCSTSTCSCGSYEPGAGVMPAPAGPPRLLPDLNAMTRRYAAYAQARDGGRQPDAGLLAAAVADDVPAWRDEVHRLEMLRRELAAELDRLQGGA